jgi:hypothetical protein
LEEERRVQAVQGEDHGGDRRTSPGAVPDTARQGSPGDKHLSNDYGDSFLQIEIAEGSSPLTQQFYLNNEYGELYPLLHNHFTLDAWSLLRAETDIDGLYLTGKLSFTGFKFIPQDKIRCAAALQVP